LFVTADAFSCVVFGTGSGLDCWSPVKLNASVNNARITFILPVIVNPKPNDFDERTLDVVVYGTLVDRTLDVDFVEFDVTVTPAMGNLIPSPTRPFPSVQFLKR
jgi:hypothetical protein